MASKRARVDFSAEAILKEIEDAKQMLDSVTDFKNRMQIKKLHEALVLTFKGQARFDIVGLLAFMFGFHTIMWIMFCIRHVPKVFDRYKNMRSKIIFQIVDYLSPGCALMEVNITEIIDLLERFGPSFPSPSAGNYSDDFRRALNELTKKEEFNFADFITPPVENCLNCSSRLSAPNPPTKCIAYTTVGPRACTKLILRCKDCKISYGRSMTTDGNGVSSYYKEGTIAGDTYIEVTNVAYMEKTLYSWLVSLINHCFVSFQGFAVSYNETFRKQIGCNFPSGCIEQDTIGSGDMPYKDGNNANIVTEQTTCTISGSEARPVLKHKDEKVHIAGELHRKTVANAFWEYELYNELVDQKVADEWLFAKKQNENMSGSKEDAIEHMVKKQITSSYDHECHQGCKIKGCGKLYVLDGNWKLTYAHCMFPVAVTITGYEKEINYPKICPRSPGHLSAFCDKHSAMVKNKGIPTDLKSFLQFCGNKNKEPSIMLEEMDFTGHEINEDNAAICQGTLDFMAHHVEVIDDCKQAAVVSCNKDTVGKTRLQKWSRGIFVIASAGGHIEYWQPLYKSESPTQAFMITIVWLFNKFKTLKECGRSDEEVLAAMKETVLAYDNMCHLDSLRISPLSPHSVAFMGKNRTAEILNIPAIG